jgi:hypothetical protein
MPHKRTQLNRSSWLNGSLVLPLLVKVHQVQIHLFFCIVCEINFSLSFGSHWLQPLCFRVENFIKRDAVTSCLIYDFLHIKLVFVEFTQNILQSFDLTMINMLCRLRLQLLKELLRVNFFLCITQLFRQHFNILLLISRRFLIRVYQTLHEIFWRYFPSKCTLDISQWKVFENVCEDFGIQSKFRLDYGIKAIQIYKNPG